MERRCCKAVAFFKRSAPYSIGSADINIESASKCFIPKESIWEANFFGFSTNLEFSSRRVLPKGSSPMPKLVSKLVVELENSSWAKFSQFDQQLSMKVYFSL